MSATFWTTTTAVVLVGSLLFSGAHTDGILMGQSPVVPSESSQLWWARRFRGMSLLNNRLRQLQRGVGTAAYKQEEKRRSRAQLI